MKVISKFALCAITVISLSPMTIAAQDTSEVPAARKQQLFEYPQAPDTISTLEGRTNYIVSRFWDKYDLSKPIKDAAGFEGAFRDYVTFFKYAHRNIVFTSIKDFMNKMQANTSNLLIVAEIAERALYDRGAEYWSDEAYLPFIKSVVESKKVKKEMKERYQIQINKIEKTLMGAVTPDLELVTVDGSKKKISDVKADVILLFFNDPDCDDCMISRLRLSTDVGINNFIEQGKLAIVSIYPGEYSKEWAENARGYADNWIIGANDKADNVYDLRFTPSFYVLDKDRKIVNKNLNLEDIKAMFN